MSNLNKSDEIVQHAKIRREDDTLKKCFAYCVNNFHVEHFVNEEEKCIKNCAKKQHSYYENLRNSMSLMENPIYLKFY